MKKSILLFFVFFLVVGVSIYAHPGRTDSSGCHTCRTNCEDWGLSYGDYHCHNGGSSSGGNTNDSTPSPPKKKIVKKKKSSNNRIKSISINDEDIAVEENMNYNTEFTYADIVIKAAHNKAKVSFTEPDELKIGTNRILITVKAENGKIRKYYLNIIRELNSDTGVIVKSSDTEIVFEDYESEIYTVDYNVDSIYLDYETNNEKATVEVIGNENLHEGENNIILRVIAENGNQQDYIIHINKEAAPAPLWQVILGLLFFVAIICGAVFGIKKYLKKKTT